jgi:hypothetical protein
VEVIKTIFVFVLVLASIIALFYAGLSGWSGPSETKK